LRATDPAWIRRATLFALAAIVALSSQDAAASQGGSFQLWPHSARELAMGDTGTLLAPGLESLFSQPASLVGLNGWELGASTQRLAEGAELALSSFTAGIGSGHRLPGLRDRTLTSRHALAIAFQHLGATLADDSGWGEWTLTAGGAWSPVRWLSVGMRGDYSRGGSEDGVDDGRALSLNVGARAVVFHPAVELGLVAEDYYHRFFWKDDEKDTRRRASAQVVSLAAYLPGRLRCEVMGRYRYRSIERLAMGLEWSPWRERFHLRGGIIAHRRVEESLSPSFGAGFLFGPLGVDYGFRYERVEGPGARHRVSLRWIGEAS